jgi:hypothetical protein
MARGEITGKKPKQFADRAQRSGPPQPKPKKKVEAAEADKQTASDTKTEKPEPASVEIAAAPLAEPCTRDAVTETRIRGPPVPTAVFSIASFCIAHGISESMYFKLRDQNQGPREMRLGTRVFITHESAARWRIEREAATIAAE